jgi:hypothetical protein
MTHQGPEDRPTAGELPDVTDFAILDRLREAYDAVDPMPVSLPDRIRFSLALRDLEYEMAQMSAEDDQHLVAARGAEQSRTITFDCDSLTVMIRIEANEDGTARIDGWLAPAQQRTVELLTTADTLTIIADDGGRFVFPQVPRGSVQLLVKAEPEREGSGRAVVAPALIL